jgi:sRNA-binding carbon storage regulator CsrA
MRVSAGTMLILSRTTGESIIIGDLSVTVTGIFNKKVQLGIVNQKEKSGFSTLEGKLEAEISIIQIRGRQVRLGIKAPPGTLILRDKLLEQE